MRHELTPERIAFYRENGFVVIDGFLSPVELAVWREAIERAIAARGLVKLPGRGEAFKAGTREHVLVQRINLWLESEEVRRLILDERIGKMAAELAGVDGVRIWQDQALIKSPWANPTAWHLDNPKWSFHSPNAISIWIALDDVSLRNGCLFFLPGTHKKEVYETTATGDRMADFFDLHPEFAGHEAIAAEMQAGSCSFHNGLTAHAAHANMTPFPRRAMTAGFMPEGSVFNGRPNILPEDYLKELKVGDVLENDAWNPVVFSRNGQRSAMLQER